MVQKYQSPVRVYKYPFELVMAVSNTQHLPCSSCWGPVGGGGLWVWLDVCDSPTAGARASAPLLQFSKKNKDQYLSMKNGSFVVRRGKKKNPQENPTLCNYSLTRKEKKVDIVRQGQFVARHLLCHISKCHSVQNLSICDPNQHCSVDVSTTGFWIILSFLIWLKAGNLWEKSLVLFFPIHFVIELSGDLFPSLVISARNLRAVIEVHSLGMQKADVDHGNCFRQSFFVIFWTLSQLGVSQIPFLKVCCCISRATFGRRWSSLWSLARFCFVIYWAFQSAEGIPGLGICYF